MICGVLVSFLTTQTEHAYHVEPLLIYSSAYMAFVVAELFHWFVYVHIWCIGIVLNFFVQVWHHQHHWLWLSCETVEIMIIFLPEFVQLILSWRRI